jgi:hypothetical protein
MFLAGHRPSNEDGDPQAPVFIADILAERRLVYIPSLLCSISRSSRDSVPWNRSDHFG